MQQQATIFVGCNQLMKSFNLQVQAFLHYKQTSLQDEFQDKTSQQLGSFEKLQITWVQVQVSKLERRNQSAKQIRCLPYNHGAPDQGVKQVWRCLCVCVRVCVLFLGVLSYFGALIFNSFQYFGALVSTLGPSFDYCFRIHFKI